MEHGELVYLRVRWNHYFVVKYRVDPVPFSGRNGVGKKWFYAWHKKPRTTQERKWSLADKKYTRGKRNKGSLPNTWDDLLRSDCRTRRSWKKRCKVRKQWQKNAGITQLAEG